MSILSLLLSVMQVNALLYLAWGTLWYSRPILGFLPGVLLFDPIGTLGTERILAAEV